MWFRKGTCENCGAMTQEKGLFGGRWVWFRKGACENCGAMTHKKRIVWRYVGVVRWVWSGTSDKGHVSLFHVTHVWEIYVLYWP